ncbi:unnamed protein product [Leptidea sinapis]|uniref:Uncharacterized protein n=1 Tax=Leptidea sinapis TaxID=189913 RepID=A0A5E4PYG1_9NEOP|nr:unnamed protein product [Leptidea sinapis]
MIYEGRAPAEARAPRGPTPTLSRGAQPCWPSYTNRRQTDVAFPTYTSSTTTREGNRNPHCRPRYQPHPLVRTRLTTTAPQRTPLTVTQNALNRK